MMAFLKNYDRVLGIILLVIVLVLFANTYTFKIRPYVPLNTTFWPRVILGLMALVSLILIFKGRVTDEDTEEFSPKSGLVFLGAGAYVLLMPLGGFLAVSTLVGAAGFYWLNENKSPRTMVFACLYGSIISGAIYLVFKELLKVQLPTVGVF